jgi:hypothetical protein
VHAGLIRLARTSGSVRGGYGEVVTESDRVAGIMRRGRGTDVVGLVLRSCTETAEWSLCWACQCEDLDETIAVLLEVGQDVRGEVVVRLDDESTIAYEESSTRLSGF